MFALLTSVLVVLLLYADRVVCDDDFQYVMSPRAIC